MLFDIILDCTGEAAKCIHLLKKGGGLCSILAGPTAESLQTVLAEGLSQHHSVTFGVKSFLSSSWGGGLFQCLSGGSRLKSECAKRDATYAHVIGTGNGSIVEKVASLMAGGQIKAVIDKVFTLENAVEAIEYQKAGRAAGKVMISVIPDE